MCCCGCGTALSCSSDLTPSLGTSVCHRYDPKKKRKNKNKQENKQCQNNGIVFVGSHKPVNAGKIKTCCYIVRIIKTLSIHQTSFFVGEDVRSRVLFFMVVNSPVLCYCPSSV